MARDERLIQFMREALSLGRSRGDIQAALKDAGWSPQEITEALASFASTDFSPPVPRPRAHMTARDTFIYLLLFASLAIVTFEFINLVHSILDITLPEPGEDHWQVDYAKDNIRWSIAALVVATPVFVWMTVFTHRQIAADAGRRRSPVRKWLTYLALFVSALLFAGDAIYVIYSFLSGEATLRFLLKALTVACASAAIFGFYVRDIEEGADER